MRRFIQLLVCTLLALLMHAPVLAADNVITIEQAQIQASDEGYRLSARFSFDLTRGLENALSHGIPLYFTTELEMSKPRWYWLDEKSVDTKQTIRIAYNVLTRQYVASIDGGLQQHYRTLDDALAMVRRPPRWVVAEPGTLTGEEAYMVAVRIRLDVSQLPKPFQVNAINNRDWRLSSDWKRFSYTVGK